jgi:hypothetical protein
MCAWGDVPQQNAREPPVDRVSLIATKHQLEAIDIRIATRHGDRNADTPGFGGRGGVIAASGYKQQQSSANDQAVTKVRVHGTLLFSAEQFQRS